MRVKLALDGLAVEVGELDAGEGEDGHVAVGEEVDIARVVENAGNVGGDEVLAFAHADDDRRARARGDDLVGLGGGKHAQRKGAGEALDGAANGVFERDRRSAGSCVVLHLLDEVGDDLGVGFGDELVALGGEFALQVEIVFDDAVVDHDDAAGAVAMRMGILFGGAAVRGPAGVADAEGAVERDARAALLPGWPACRERGRLRAGRVGTAHGDAGRVVAAVLEAPQTFDDDWNDLLAADVTDDSAHDSILCEGPDELGTLWMNDRDRQESR